MTSKALSSPIPHPAFGHPLSGGEGQTPRRWPRVIALLAFVGLIALGVVITIETNKGTLIVESLREGVEVRVKRSGKAVNQLELTSGPKSTRLAAGEYEIEIVGDSDGLQIQNGRFLLKRGDTVVAKIIEQPRVAASGSLSSVLPGMSPTGVFPGNPGIGSPQRSTPPLGGYPGGVGTGDPFTPATGDSTGDTSSTGSPPPAGLPGGMGTPRGEIVDRNAKGMESFEASNPDLADELAIRAKLLKPITVEFVEIPIKDAVVFLADRTGVPFHLDVDALSEEGISPDLPVSLSLMEKPTTAVLEFLLRPMSLAWHIDGGQVVITILQVEQQTLVTRMYPVGKLLPGVRQAVARLQAEPDPNAAAGGGVLGPGGGFFQVGPFASAPLAATVFGQFGGGGFGGGLGGLGGQVAEPSKPTVEFHFANLLEFSIVQPWMNTHGAGGSAELLHNVLMVRQSHAAHSEIESLLRTLEAAFLKPLTEPAEVRPAGYSLEADANVRNQLARKLDINFVDTPLTDVASWLSDQLTVQVLIDQEALSEEGIAPDTPVTLSFQGIAVDVVLQRILQPLQLNYDVEHGVLVFTSVERLTQRLVTKVYDVREVLDRGLHPSRLIAGLESTTPGPWMNVDGEGGTLFLFADTLLIVRQTGHNHVEVAKFLRGLREAMSDQPVVPRATLPRKIPVVGMANPEAPGPNKKSTGTTGSGSAKVNSNVPRYDGKSFDEWLAVLDSERSPVRLADALEALRLLLDTKQTRTVCEKTLKLFRVVDVHSNWGARDDRRSLSWYLIDLLNNLPRQELAQAAAIELRNGNLRSRKMVFDIVISNSIVPIGNSIAKYFGDPTLRSESITLEVLNLTRDPNAEIGISALWWLARRGQKDLSQGLQQRIQKEWQSRLADKDGVVALIAVHALVDSEADADAVSEVLKRVISQQKEESRFPFWSGPRIDALRYAALMGPRATPAAKAIADVLLEKDDFIPGQGIVPPFGGGGFFSVPSAGDDFGGGRNRQMELSRKQLAALALARIGNAAAETIPTIEAAFNKTKPDNTVWQFDDGGVAAEFLDRPSTLSETLLGTFHRLRKTLAEDVSKALKARDADGLGNALARYKLARDERVLLESHYGTDSDHPGLHEAKAKETEERRRLRPEVNVPRHPAPGSKGTSPSYKSSAKDDDTK